MSDKSRDLILNDTVGKIIAGVTVNREYNVPYLAGYNNAASVIYIDSRLPKTHTQKDGKELSVDRYLTMHEVFEGILLRDFKMSYQNAHQMALYIEKASVVADGYSWEEYNEFMWHHIRLVEKEGFVKIPPDLNMQPYEDCNDNDLIVRMKTAQEEGGVISEEVVSEESFITARPCGCISKHNPPSMKW